MPSEHEIPMDGHLSRFSTFELHPASTGFLNINWPSAVEHPLFYVGIYAAIGLTTAFVSILSSVAQITGALRASRTLFKYAFYHLRLSFLTAYRALLVSVVRATFRCVAFIRAAPTNPNFLPASTIRPRRVSCI